MRMKIAASFFSFCLLILGTIYTFSHLVTRNTPSAILIHGCHLETKNWEAIMFGDELHQGRVTSGIEEALKQRAELIVWGSGSSSTNEGIKESEYTFIQATTSHLNQLAKKVNLSPSKLLNFLTKVSHLEIHARNTAEEIRSALDICSQKNIPKLTLISSPTHIARCLQEGCKQKTEHPYSNIRIYATASDTCFADSTAQDVVIIEPPHRMDRSQLPIHTLMKKLLPLLQEKNKENRLYADLTQLLDPYTSPDNSLMP